MAYRRSSRSGRSRGFSRSTRSSYRSAPRRSAGARRSSGGRRTASRTRDIRLVIETQPASTVSRPSYLAAMNPAFTAAGVPTKGKAKL